MNYKFIALGVFFIVCAVIVLRIIRRSSGTYADKKKASAMTIAGAAKQIHEENLSIPFCEHMLIMNHAMQELLDLMGNPQGYSVKQNDKCVYFDTPKGTIKVIFLSKVQHLKGRNKDICSAELWEIQDYDDFKTEYKNMKQVIHALHQFVANKDESEKITRINANPFKSGQQYLK